MLKLNAQGSQIIFRKTLTILSLRKVAVHQGITSILWDQMGQWTLPTVRCGATRIESVEALLLIWETSVTSRVKIVEIISGLKPMLMLYLKQGKSCPQSCSQLMLCVTTLLDHAINL